MEGDFKPAKKPAKSLPDTPTESSAETQTPDQNFKTPEEMAAVDDISETDEILPDSSQPEAADPNEKQGWKAKLAALKPVWPFGVKEYVYCGVLVVLIAGIVSFVLISQGSNTSRVTPVKHSKKVAAKPTTVPSTLSGLPVDPSVNARPVTGVMIENSMDARPQSGLSEANVVFEAIAEGGITRFLALYQDTAPEDIGPVRSARPYYVQWELGFDAGYAHVGGSPAALADIKAWGVRDLDQFANGGSYHRVSSRAAPHNVYTSMSSLNQLEVAKGYTSSVFTGFPRKKAAPAKTPASKSIDLGLSGSLYNVHYDYIPTTNSYNRSEGGAPHVDANGSKQISPKVVIAMVVPYGIASDGYHSDYQAIGSGQVFVFQDGNVQTGTWAKTSEKSQITFADAAGKTIGLNPGQTWITAVNDAGKVTYAP